VVFVWIDDELRVDTETAQRLVHLLTTLDRHVEVSLAPEKQRGCLNAIGVQERIRDFNVRLPRLWIPGWSNLVVVLNDVLIRPIERDRESRARAARSRFESIVGRDQVISEYAAITPATDTKPIPVRTS
jgi:hypothetical protein